MTTVSISSAAELVAFANRVNAGEASLNAELTADIDMAGVSFTPIGNFNRFYQGVFDGCGHTISNISISSSSLYGTGLIGAITGDGTAVKNIRVSNFNVSGSDYVGALIGYADYRVQIYNCAGVNCTVTATRMQGGGLVGGIYNCRPVHDCYAFGCTINGDSENGGFAGMSYGTTITNCYAFNCTLTVGSGSTNGGFVGLANHATVSNCAVYGGNYGNIVSGETFISTITNCYSSADISSNVFHVKGFWSGSMIGGSSRLNWDFSTIWEWDVFTHLPELKQFYVAPYEWMDESGKRTSLMNPEEFVILREGIHGFADITEERNLASVANQLGERFTSTSGKAREFGFDIMIIANSHDDLAVKRSKLLKLFSRPGRLYKRLDADTTVHIDCYASRGSPEIQNGIAPNAMQQQVSINLVAPDPYFYGESVTVTLPAGASSLTVNNPGVSELTPCSMVLNADTATNTTTGQIMTALTGQTINGATVTVTDNGVSATLNNTNMLGRFTYDSEFWMLAEGTNNLTGVASITFRPRWKGV